MNGGFGMGWKAASVALIALSLAVTACAPRQQTKTAAPRTPTCKSLSGSYNYFSEQELLDCKHLANMGSTEAAFTLGEYLSGRGKNSDGLMWLDMAAEKGHSGALMRLFNVYRIGGEIPKNGAKSEEYFAKAVERKAEWALLMEARRNEAADPARSFAVYLDFARKGNCHAQIKVARSYFKGDIIGQNLTQAYFWSLVVPTTAKTPAEYHPVSSLYYDTPGYERSDALDRLLSNSALKTPCYSYDTLLPKLEKTLPAESVQIAQTAATEWRKGQQEPLLPPPQGIVNQEACIGLECIASAVNKSKQAKPGQVVAARPERKAGTSLPPPRIDVPGKLSTDGATVRIEGQVFSASGAGTLTIDGSPVPVTSDGRFTVARPVPVGDTSLRLVAMDTLGQRSESVATVTRTTPAETGPSYPPPVPTAVKGIRNGDAVALIVGIEGYESAPKAAYAEQDARVFYDYAVNVLGIPADNVKLLVGKGARRLDIEKTLATWVPPRVSSGKTDVVVFFAGHGLASDDGKELFLLPHDGDRDVLAESAVRRSRIVDALKSAGVRRVTLLLDTCYSGSTREGEALLANARPVALVAKEGDLPDGVTMISAAQGDQISLSLKEAGHGLFSYTLMKGLEGAADVDGDRRITAAELHAFVSDRVAREASRSGRRQTPMLVGDGSQILARW